MSKIQFENEGTTYIMEFDRDSAAKTEKAFGVTLSDVQAGKVTVLRDLFHGAFLKHHPKIKTNTVNAFYDRMPDKMELYKQLSIMYFEGVEALLDEPEEGNALSWKTV